MVPDKFNMVDMDGIDLIMMQGEEVPGLYMRLVESITQCRYQCLYNWFFDGVVIPPTYVILEVNEDDEVAINEGVTVSPDDVIHIYSVEPGPVDPEIIPLLAEENGVYNVPAGKDGFNPVTVNVTTGTNILSGKSVPSQQIGEDGDIYLKYGYPDGYDAIEYLEASGNQFIDTGIDISSNTYFELEASFTSNVNNNNIYGLGFSNKESNCLVVGSIYNQIGGRNISISYDTNRHIFGAGAESIYIDNISGTPNWSNVPSGQRVHLFATAYNGSMSTDRISYGRIYYCKIFSGSVLVRHFIPMRRVSDDELGMYDIVNDVFYSNSGTGSFIAGADLPGDIINAAYCKVSGSWQNLIGSSINDINGG